MDVRSNIITNAVSVALLLILRYVARSRTLRARAEDRIYAVMIFGVMLGSVMDALSFVIDGKTFFGARVLNYFLNTYIYSANMLLPFLMLVYVDLCLYGRKNRIWARYKIHIIVGAVMAAVNIVNYFVPISYVITENNVYERRPFSYAYYAVILFYFISIFLLLHKYKKENGEKSFISFGMFIVPIAVGTGLQFLFYGLSLAWLSSAMGLIGLFMMQQNELAFIDPLVGTYNRQYMDRIISSWIGHNRSFAGAMIDIDRFKEINDTYGHAEGDSALTSLASIMKQSGDGREWLFRFAGDEFVVLKLADSEDELDGFIKDVNAQINQFNLGDHPYKLSVSTGSSFCTGGNVDAFVKEMDGRMYEMKKQHHAKLDVPGEQ